MIVDASAAVAVILVEESAAPLAEALAGADDISIGAPTLFEAAMVLISREGEAGVLALASFLQRNEIAAVPFDERHSAVAAEAFFRYGKGRHPARLNYGDCMTYATARVAGRPLLCVGGDFAMTDLPLALV